MKKTVVLITMMLIFAGCAGLEELKRNNEENWHRINEFVRDHSTEQMKEVIAKKQIVIGMNVIEVRASIGHPRDINKTVGTWGVHEQWIYGYGRYDRMYLYFENSILTSWQD